MTSLLSLPDFLIWFISALALLGVFLRIYTFMTRHDEWALLKAGNTAAAVSLLGATLGFALPLASVIAHAADFLDLLVWAAVAMIVQLLSYFLVYVVRHDVSAAIARGEMASAVLVGGGGVVLGVINAACLTY
jgi:putative membrane protein